jgi:hypothetical protein
VEEFGEMALNTAAKKFSHITRLIGGDLDVTVDLRNTNHVARTNSLY